MSVQYFNWQIDEKSINILHSPIGKLTNRKKNDKDST